MPLIFVALACAFSLTTVTPVNYPNQITTEAASEIKTDARLYQAGRTLDLLPVSTETERGEVANDKAEHLQLEKGDYVVLEGLRIDGRGRRLLRISFDPIDEDQASTYWIDAAELGPRDLESAIATPEQLSSIDEADHASSADEFAVTQVASRRHGMYARHARRNNFCISHPTHARCCKSAVNYKLLAAGLIRTRVPGMRARTMATGLKKQGWREVGCGARERPSRGMTCTLVGRDNDHTETFMGGCWYYGSACTARPMHQSNRQCISCKVPGHG